MKKIIITEQQYNLIKQYEDTNKKQLNENLEDVIMFIKKLTGSEFTGFNKKVSDEIFNNNEVLLDAEKMLEDKSLFKTLKDKMKEKGLENPDMFFNDNYEKIVTNFNSLTKERKISNKIGRLAIDNMKKKN